MACRHWGGLNWRFANDSGAGRRKMRFPGIHQGGDEEEGEDEQRKFCHALVAIRHGHTAICALNRDRIGASVPFARHGMELATGTSTMQTLVFHSKYRKSCVLPAAAILVLRLALCSVQAADKDNRGQLTSSDYKFAKAAACGGMFEVSAGRIASDRSTNAAVQQFGQRMMKDHTKVGQDLQLIATRNGARLPSEPTADQQKEIDKLNTLASAEFDKAYIALMVKDHKGDAKDFKKESEDADNPELKAFAGNTLAIVQDHLKMAQDLEQSLKRNLSSR